MKKQEQTNLMMNVVMNQKSRGLTKGSPSPKVSDESSLALVFVELTSLKIFPLEPASPPQAT
jgi:hypothetical protein